MEYEGGYINNMLGMEISDKEFSLFSRIIEESSGIKLGIHKKELLKNRLYRRLNLLGLTSFSEYFRYVTEIDKTGHELTQMVTAISTNVTYFFREEDHFDFLRERVLPDIFKRKGKDGLKKIRCWSAGCSTGEEAYTIAITMCDFFNDGLRDWDIRILATDVSTKVLDTAKRGVYKLSALENVPSHLVKRNFYRGFDMCEGLTMVKRHLKEMVHIRYLNLMDDSFPFKGPFDFIFCRNVMIYFDKPTQRELLSKFHRYLDHGGHLFLGHSEGLTGTHSGFKYVAPAVYVRQ